MTNELMKLTPAVDGFAGWNDHHDDNAHHQPSTGRVIQGGLVKFSNEAKWIDRDGTELPREIELVAVDIGRVVQKWKDHAPVETIVLEPGQNFPDIEALNEKTPRSEWTTGPDGKERGPWQKQHVVYLLNAATMDRFSYPTGTTGGAIAIGELRDKVQWMRRYRGAHVYPVVQLADVHMPTRFGGRQRPHFVIKNWITLGHEKKELPAPEQAAVVQPLPAPAKVAEPTLKEQMNDEIPWNDPIDDLTRPQKPVMTKSGVQKIAGARN